MAGRRLTLTCGSASDPETLHAEIRLDGRLVVWVEAVAGGRATVEMDRLELADLELFERLVDLLREAQAWVAPLAADQSLGLNG